MKTKEIKNGRLAMVACLGFVAQHAATGSTPLQALGEHLANPMVANFATKCVTARVPPILPSPTRVAAQSLASCVHAVHA
jgi:hypothetical protein